MLTPVLNVDTNVSKTAFALISKNNVMPGEFGGGYTNYCGLGGTSGTAKIRVFLAKTYASDLETANTLLTNKNFTIYFKMATFTNEPITDTTLINQLNLIEKAYAYNTQTNVSQTNDNKPFIISAETIRSLVDVFD